VACCCSDSGPCHKVSVSVARKPANPDQSVLGKCLLTSHARLEVEVEGEDRRQRVESAPAEYLTNVPVLGLTSHGRANVEDRCDGATGVESGGSTKPLDIAGIDGSEDHTTPGTISKPKSKFPKPVIPTMPNLPSSGLLYGAMICYQLTLAPQVCSLINEQVQISLVKYLLSLPGPVSSH
jgi:hypothetical protein